MAIMTRVTFDIYEPVSTRSRCVIIKGMDHVEPPHSWPSLLTVAQAAAMLGRNEQTVRSLLRAGVIRGRRLPGGAYVLRRDHVLLDADRHAVEVADAYRHRRRASA